MNEWSKKLIKELGKENPDALNILIIKYDSEGHISEDEVQEIIRKLLENNNSGIRALSFKFLQMITDEEYRVHIIKKALEDSSWVMRADAVLFAMKYVDDEKTKAKVIEKGLNDRHYLVSSIVYENLSYMEKLKSLKENG